MNRLTSSYPQENMFGKMRGRFNEAHAYQLDRKALQAAMAVYCCLNEADTRAFCAWLGNLRKVTGPKLPSDSELRK